MRKAIVLFSIMSVALLVMQSPVLAQTITGSLSGTVTDPTGAVVVGAQVVLTSESSGTTNTAKTNGSGFFSFPALLPGTYDLAISSRSFSTYKETGIALSEHESRTVSNITLRPGAESQVVEVTENAVPVPVDSGASSTTLNNLMVSQIAIQGRDAAELIRLMPAMAMNSGLSQSQWNSAVTQINNGPIGNFSSNGTQPYGGMQLIMNGSVITDSGNQGTQIANVNQDMTSELTIQNSSFDAEYAHGPVTVSATGKSGTKDFHGEAYGYARNGSLNANNSFLNASNVKKPIDHYWYPGGNLGGPIIIPGTGFNKNHDKAFFFVGFERLLQQPAGTLHKYIVPTAPWMSGDFTSSAMAPYVANYGTNEIPCSAGAVGASNYGTAAKPGFCRSAVDAGQITLFDQSGNPISPAAYDASVDAGSAMTVSGSKISPSIIDPNGQILMKLLSGAPGLTPINPSTPCPGGQPCGFNTQFLDRPPVNSNELTVRGDVNITQKMKAFATLTRQTEGDINNIGLWWWAGDAVPYPSQTPANQLSRAWSVGVTNTLSSTMVNEATFGYAYFINPVTLANPKAADPATYGYNVKTPFQQPVPQIPDIVSWCCSPGGGNSANSATAAGFNASSFGTNPAWQGNAAGKDSYTPDFADNFSWVKGRHSMKFGYFQARYANVQTEGACCGGGTVGQWEFDPWNSQGTGNLYADMLLGRAAGYSQAGTNFVDNVRYNEYSFYLQDKWQIHPRVTLSYGVRNEHEGQWYPANENKGIMVWNPNNKVQPYSKTSTNPLAGFDWHGIDPSVPLSGWSSKPLYVDPRAGVAWDLFGDGRTVLRGGFGVYRFQIAYNSVTGGGMLDAPLGLKNFSSNCTFTSLASLGTCGAAAAGARNTTNYGGMLAGDDATPYTQTWNVMIDQRFPWRSHFELQYVGNRSRDLLISNNGAGGIGLAGINYVPIGGLFKPDPVTGITYECQGTTSSTCVAGDPPSSALPDFRPYDYGNGLYALRHGSYSNYNGLVAQWMKQSGPAVFNLNYTWSHTLGIRDGTNDNGQGSGASVDSFNLRNNYGTLAYNRFHVFNASYVLNLPSPIHGNAFLGQAINGWQLSGVLQLQSGPPLQPLTGGRLNAGFPGGVSNQSILGTDGIQLQPYLTCDPRSGGGQFFNTGCFAVPTTRGVNGPTVWPTIVGPGYVDTDMGIYKNFAVTERQKIQFRLTAFNLVNHPNQQFGLGSDVNLSFGCPKGQTCSSVSQYGNTNAKTTGNPQYTYGNRTVEIALKYIF